MDDLACTECMWTGNTDTQDYAYCPKCGGEIEYIDNYDRLPTEQDFNWNKK